MILSDFGTLHLPFIEEPTPEIPDAWLNCAPNALTAAATVILALMGFSSYLRLRPHLLECVTKKRGPENLEHNLQSAHDRNFWVWIAFLAAASLTDRFELYRPEWIEALPKAWSLAATGGAILGFFLLRLILHLLLRPKKIKGDALLALRRSVFSFAVLLCVSATLSVGILLLFKTSDESISTILYIETIMFLLWNYIREFQILREKYSALISFLYLCGLEIVPVVLLIVSAVLL